ncbi:MAG: hypothetical protein KDM64_01050 [Verrucomicrobiae bacterium]|nr:hypothetical protein [Verrucomicrobiae bacterium]
MTGTPSIQAISSLATLLWPVLQGFLLYAAILFFRVDRRLHTWSLLIGASLALLLGLWRLVATAVMVRMVTPGSNLFGQSFAIQTGLSIIAQAMIVYGLVAIATIHFRRSREGAFSDPTGSGR